MLLIRAIYLPNFKWSQLVGVTTDGAPSMTGRESGLVALLRKKEIEYSESDLIHYHCIVHQEALVARVLNLNDVVKIVVKSVNFIKKTGLHHQQFQTFLKRVQTRTWRCNTLCFSLKTEQGAKLSDSFPLKRELANSWLWKTRLYLNWRVISGYAV